MANTDLSALLKSEAIRAVLLAPNRKGCGVRTNPDHSVHASAEPLCRCGEEERGVDQGEEPQGQGNLDLHFRY